MRFGEYVLMTSAAPGVQMTCDWMYFSNFHTSVAAHSGGLTMSHPSLALAMAEKYGAPV